MIKTTDAPGALTEAEILSEPDCWGACIEHLKKSQESAELLGHSVSCEDWLFIGCGSSYYIALAAAASWTAITGLRARAIPASELLLYPELVLLKEQPVQPVLISRSGKTSEVLKAAEYLKSRGIQSLAITCAPGEKLQKAAAATLCLADADEQSMVMTRSFTSMLLGIQFVAAKHADDSEFGGMLAKMAAGAKHALDGMAGRLREFVESHTFGDYVFLGQGPFHGLAAEGALKVQEMSCSYSQSFHTLEFRHGPKSITAPDTLITFLLSERGQDGEIDLLEEVKGLGGTTLVVSNEATPKVRRSADLWVELRLEAREIARLAAYLLPCQLLGLYTGLKKGQNPDRPKNLSRVVVL
jgi:glucosamine--fructose-6-phosphate aminotransferase (isomerizing)